MVTEGAQVEAVVEDLVGDLVGAKVDTNIFNTFYTQGDV